MINSMCMSWFSVLYIGGKDCLQPLNRRIYNYALTQTKQPPSVYHTDIELFNACSELVNHVFGLDVVCDTTPSNCFEIYKYLINNIRWIHVFLYFHYSYISHVIVRYSMWCEWECISHTATYYICMCVCHLGCWMSFIYIQHMHTTINFYTGWFYSQQFFAYIYIVICWYTANPVTEFTNWIEYKYTYEFKWVRKQPPDTTQWRCLYMRHTVTNHETI